MNPYLKLYDEVMGQSRDGTLHWRQIGRGDNADIILDSLSVMRQFETAFQRYGINYKLLCVEKRLYVEEDLFLGTEESVGELLVVRDGELVDRLAEPSLGWYRLQCMANEIALLADKASRLYEAPAEPTLP